jgi:hypothetical protein
MNSEESKSVASSEKEPARMRASGSLAKKTPTQSLLPIPGLGSGGAAKEIQRRGKTYSVLDIARAAGSANVEAQIAAITVLGDLTSLNRQELALAASTLHNIALITEAPHHEAQRAFTTLITAHLDLPEALHLAVQAIRVWEEHPICTVACTALTDAVSPRLIQAGRLRQATRSLFIEQAHILSKAALTRAFAQQSIAELRTILESGAPTTTAHRRELAGITATSIRKVRNPSSELLSLQTLASAVLTTGAVATALHRTSAPIIHNKPSETVTAQQAEQRRQFGLAVTIELIKSIPLIGRPLNADEFENCLRFNFSPASVLPANRFWPTRSEWHTIERCLVFAEQNEGLSALRLAALFRILATRIKVEDPKDPRESKRRADILTPNERLEALKASERVRQKANLTAADIDAVAQEIAGRLLAMEFTNWTADITEPALLEKDNNLEQKTAILIRELIDRIKSDPSGKTVARLKPEELRILSAAKGLPLVEFKELTRLLLHRAITDDLTRSTLLLIVQAQHAAEVTAVVRTATLGNLLNEARRFGAPAPELEREVLAISAKIPRLKLVAAPDSPSSDE